MPDKPLCVYHPGEYHQRAVVTFLFAPAVFGKCAVGFTGLEIGVADIKYDQFVINVEQTADVII